MARMVIYGDVDADGSYAVTGGSDGTFSARRVDEGTYAIDFVPDFAEAPVVMVTVRSTGITEHKEDVALVRPEPGQCLVFMRNSATADRQDADFSFIAVGLANGSAAMGKRAAEESAGADSEGITHSVLPDPDS